MGVLLLAIIVSAMLYGMSLVQSLYYYTCMYPSAKIRVGLLWLLTDQQQAILMTYGIWDCWYVKTLQPSCPFIPVLISIVKGRNHCGLRHSAYGIHYSHEYALSLTLSSLCSTLDASSLSLPNHELLVRFLNFLLRSRLVNSILATRWRWREWSGWYFSL